MNVKGASRRGGKFCCAGLPNGESCTNNSQIPGISMHRFPKNPSIRKQWTRFVRRYRKQFDPFVYTAGPFLCSTHFENTAYSRAAFNLPEFDTNNTKAFLNRDAVPTISHPPSRDADDQLTLREKRVVSNDSRILSLAPAIENVVQINDAKTRGSVWIVKDLCFRCSFIICHVVFCMIAQLPNKRKVQKW